MSSACSRSEKTTRACVPSMCRCVSARQSSPFSSRAVFFARASRRSILGMKFARLSSPLRRDCASFSDERNSRNSKDDARIFSQESQRLIRTNRPLRSFGRDVVVFLPRIFTAAETTRRYSRFSRATRYAVSRKMKISEITRGFYIPAIGSRDQS